MTLENHEYEKALLGCILLDNRVLEEMQVSRKLFDSNDCLAVYDEIRNTIARKASPTIYELGLMRPDLATFIAGLSQQVPSSANARFYYDSLVDLARRRGLSKLAREVAYKAANDAKADEIFDYIDAAVSEISDIRQTGYKHIKEIMPDVLRVIESYSHNKGKLTGIPTGFSQLDARTNGWQPQEMIVIGARPGTGKTSIALNLSSAALRADKRVGFFSAEMSAQSIMLRVLADWGTVSHRNMTRGSMTPAEYQGLLDATGALVTKNLYIDDTPNISLSALVSGARKMKRKEGIDLLMVDYLSLISNERQDVPRHEQVAQISKTIKGLARELDIPIVVLSQLTREAQGERPKLSQLRDSGAVEQDADIVILLQQCGVEEVKGVKKIKINLIVEKNRSGDSGDIPMVFTPSWMRFNEQTCYE